MSKEKRCPNSAEFRYTWPGRVEELICKEHAEQAIELVGALGMHLQMIQLSMSDRVPGKPCHQIIRDE